MKQNIFQWASSASLEEVLTKQEEIVKFIEDTGSFKLLGYTSAHDFFVDMVVKQKKQAKTKKSTSPLADPLQEFAEVNKELILSCYTNAIQKNKTDGIYKAGFGATFDMAIASGDITITKDKIDDDFTLCNGKIKLECRFFASPA